MKWKCLNCISFRKDEKQKMKIMQVVPSFDFGGAETMCESLIYALKKRGYSIFAVSLYTNKTPITERLERHGVEMFYLDKQPGLDISMVSKLVHIMRCKQPDIVHTHLDVIKYAVLAAKITKIKGCIHTIHNVANKEASGMAMRVNKFFYKHKWSVPVALSELVRESIIQYYQMDKEKIPVILNGVDLSKCKPKRNYSVDGNFKILHIGRFSEQKNHRGLIEAFYAFHTQYPNSELWLIGDGIMKNEIEEYVKNKQISGSVKFLGLQNDVHGYLHDADIFTLPSYYEGIPMTLIEAMGSGLPIVATAVGGVPDMLNEVSAILVPVDSNIIAEALKNYYLNEQLRENHGLAALELSKCFSVETMADQYISVYETISEISSIN